MRKLVFIFLFFVAFGAFAQKLPNKQETSVWAPANVKIDGKANEWKDEYQAHNKATNIFYTVANNSTNLVLIIKATDPDIIKKIVTGGVTFTVSTTGKKNADLAPAITFPAYDKEHHPVFLVLNDRPDFSKEDARTKFLSDSLMTEYNKQLANGFKMIHVTGIKSIQDTVISIYNEQGIKQAALFDNKLSYVCELSIPFSLLGIGPDQSKLTYHIVLNGETANGSSMKIMPTRKGDIISYRGSDGINYNLGKATPDNLANAVPTDFWGEYTLVNAP